MIKKRKYGFWRRMMAVMISAAMIVGIADGAAPNMAFAQETASENALARASGVSETWSGTISAKTLSGGTKENPKVIEVSGLVKVSGKITVSGHVKFTGTNSGTLQWTSGYWNAIVVEEGASATFENVTLDGNGNKFDRAALLFQGTVALNAGTTVKNFTSTGYSVQFQEIRV